MQLSDEDIESRLAMHNQHAVDGSQGALRNQLPSARAWAGHSDLNAIAAYLRSRANHKTRYNYWREIDRFLLWIYTERRIALTDVSARDLLDYDRFLEDPPQSWRSDGIETPALADPPRFRHYPAKSGFHRFPRPGGQESPERWRPFCKGLSVSSRRAALIALRAMYRWLVRLGYLNATPFSTEVMPPAPRKRTVENYLTTDTLQILLDTLAAREPDTPRARLKLRRQIWVVKLLYYTGARAEEIVTAKTNSFVLSDEDVWCWEVRGKSRGVDDQPDVVPLADALIDEWQRYRSSLGLTPLPTSPYEETPLICKVPATGKRVRASKKIPQPITVSMLYQLVTETCYSVAEERRDELNTRQIRQLEAASPHVLRHSLATHLQNGGGNLEVTRQYLRHADIRMTTRYIHASVRDLKDAQKVGLDAAFSSRGIDREKMGNRED